MNQALSPEQAKELADEISALSKMQSAALQTAAYIRMSSTEAKAYDKRRERIGELCTLLGKFKSEDCPNPERTKT